MIQPKKTIKICEYGTSEDKHHIEYVKDIVYKIKKSILSFEKVEIDIILRTENSDIEKFKKSLYRIVEKLTEDMGVETIHKSLYFSNEHSDITRGLLSGDREVRRWQFDEDTSNKYLLISQRINRARQIEDLTEALEVGKDVHMKIITFKDYGDINSQEMQLVLNSTIKIDATGCNKIIPRDLSLEEELHLLGY